MLHPILYCPDVAGAGVSQTPLLQEWIERLSLSPMNSAQELPSDGQVLSFEAGVLSLLPLGKKAPGPVWVEFSSGAVDHRRKFGGGAGQMIAKAVGVRRSRPLTVLDATAGLGRDAFVLATLGNHLLLQERNPVVAALLQDGLRRALLADDAEVREIAGRMTLISADSLAAMPEADVVYLDPMFPERSKSASVKKEMALFHDLVGADQDADGLLDRALQQARYRVVVKRPRKAPFLANRSPSHQLEGKTSRYDVYVNQKIPDADE